MAVGTTSLPTPVVIVGAALCVLAGYLLGVVLGPDSPERTEGTVASYDRDDNVLCLVGDEVAGVPGAVDDEVCGTWRRTPGSPAPAEGDAFEFVTLVTADEREDDDGGDDGEGRVLIYGDVVGAAR
jgi:hypothetical protein